jgi:hypothetical protein
LRVIGILVLIGIAIHAVWMIAPAFAFGMPAMAALAGLAIAFALAGAAQLPAWRHGVKDGRA